MSQLLKTLIHYYLKLYKMIFSCTRRDSETVEHPSAFIGFGNVLLERNVELLNTDLLEKYNVMSGSSGVLEMDILKELIAETCASNYCVASAGGAALNTVRIVKQLGHEALFFGAVGNDEDAHKINNTLRTIGVQNNFETIDDAPTGQCLRMVYKGKRTTCVNIGASVEFTIDHLQRVEQKEKSFLSKIDRKQILYVEGFFIPERTDVCAFIMDNYIRGRRRLALNLSSASIVQENFDIVLHMVQKAFFIFGNESEYQQLVDGMEAGDIEQMAETLLSEEIKNIIIMKCNTGVQLITNYINWNSMPGPIIFYNFNFKTPNMQVDETGYGDAFAAAFLVAWLEKHTPTDCVRFANDVASQVFTQIGCTMPLEFSRNSGYGKRSTS